MYRILIVEDDRGIAAAIKAQAEMWSLEAVCAEDSAMCSGNLRGCSRTLCFWI